MTRVTQELGKGDMDTIETAFSFFKDLKACPKQTRHFSVLNESKNAMYVVAKPQAIKTGRFHFHLSWKFRFSYLEKVAI